MSSAVAARPPRHRHRSEPQPFDFRTPTKIGREHIRALQMVNEVFARQVATVFASSLRVVSQVTVTGIQQMPWREFVSSTPDPSYLAVITLDPLPGTGVLQLPLPMVMTAVDLLLGGSGKGRLPARGLTEIEAGLMRDLMTRALRELALAMEPLMAVESVVTQQESSLQFAQIAGAADATVVSTYELRIGETVATASLCLPVTTIQPLLDVAQQMAGSNSRTRADGAQTARAAVTARLLETEVAIAVCFRRVLLTPGDILDLAVGDVLPLNHPVTEPLTMYAEGRPVLAARPGRRGKRLACVVVDLPPEDTERA
ncbi:MAG TPA: FliM/FliN family flagellar motor switch protein [Acidimicrobiales bacterium]|nr:FliM/FliN family flagellar motor switch protein [Acidimicrobiales bacterium]